MKAEEKDIKIVAQNKKALHDYFVEAEYEAGIELFGTEVKSIRNGAVNLKDSYVSVKTGEAYLLGMHISPYEKGNIFNRDPLRSRRLLLHKREIHKLIGLTQQDGYTLIPLKMYFVGQYVKVLIGVCRGKKNYDKRDSIAERDSKRRMERAFKELNQ
ncbi:MAG: SsrA-binding protein SmpB [Clostridia bacterium]|nr:SsrA-binding protein SmpB [Clostridia bacterium]